MNKFEHDEAAQIKLSVNGRARSFTSEARQSLADAIRYELGLTGTKVGCEHGVCGACTILLNGEAVRSCLMLAVQARDCEIETIEGMSDKQSLNPLQESFRRHHALQCGFCSAGMLASAVDLLRRDPNPTRQQVREAISGNLCRCTGYETIVDAICDEKVTAFARGKWHE